MYSGLKAIVLALLKVPPEPTDPMGEVEMLKVFRAAPNYYKYKLIVWAIGQAVGIVIASVVCIGLLVGLGPTGAALDLCGLAFYGSVVALSYATLRLDYEMRWYKVTDRSLRIREGVWFVREMTMTFANIQNISIEQGPIQRYFGIADLRVRSAGGGGMSSDTQGGEGAFFNAHVAYFRGVSNAEEIRDLILQRLRRLKDGGLGDHEDAAENTHMDPEPVSTAGLPPAGLAALRAIADEAKAFRTAAEALNPG